MEEKSKEENHGNSSLFSSFLNNRKVAKGCFILLYKI
jgi:hypothetical protein